MDKVKTFCFVLFYIVLAMIVYFTGFDLMQVFAEDKVYNYFDQAQNNTKYYYSTITKLPSEQYDTYNWYFWETELNLSQRMDKLVDYVTSRTYTYIDPNNLDYFVQCRAVFRSSQHLLSNLNTDNGTSANNCVIVFYDTTAGTMTFTISPQYTYASSYTNYNLNGNSSSNYLPSSTSYLGYISGSKVKYLTLDYNVTSAFFTTSINDLDTWLANNVSLGSYLDRSTGVSYSNNMGQYGIYYNSINNWNTTKYPNYNFSYFMYKVPSSATLSIYNYTYTSTLTGQSLTSCRIINGLSTCDNNFQFVDYYTYKQNGGTINQDENGLPNVNSGAGADYTQQLEDIIDSINYDGETSTIPDVDPSIINDTISNNNALLDNSNIQDFDFEDYSISGDLSDGITYVMYKIQILFVALPWYVDLVGVCLTLSIVAMLLNRK